MSADRFSGRRPTLVPVKPSHRPEAYLTVGSKSSAMTEMIDDQLWPLAEPLSAENEHERDRYVHLHVAPGLASDKFASAPSELQLR